MKTKPVSKVKPAVKSPPKSKRAGSELDDDELGKVTGGTPLLSNISKTRSEISLTFARNARG
jgi:hypothetical protein